MLEFIDALPSHFSEKEFFAEIIEHLRVDMEGNWTILATNSTDSLPTTRFPKILFLTSEESHGIPPCVHDPSVSLIFKQYAPLAGGHYKIRPLPLGFSKGYRASGTIPIENRKYSYGFAGHNHRGRRQFRSASCKLEETFPGRGYVKWTRGFATGLDIKQYSDLMDQCKIALCPEGQKSSETFRYFEALIAGCVIVTCRKPETWFYQDAPHITIDDWHDLSDVVGSTLSNLSEMQELSHRSIKWWQDFCSPKPLAQYMVREIRSLMGTTQ